MPVRDHDPNAKCWRHNGEADENPEMLGGRPAHEPNENIRRVVKALAMEGKPRTYICEALGISRETLYKYYGDDIKNAKLIADEKVIQTAYNLAVDGEHPRMTKFWLQTQRGWSKKTTIEHVGDAANPVHTRGDQQMKIPLHKLSKDALEEVEQLLLNQDQSEDGGD